LKNEEKFKSGADWLWQNVTIYNALCRRKGWQDGLCI